MIHLYVSFHLCKKKLHIDLNRNININTYMREREPVKRYHVHVPLQISL